MKKWKKNNKRDKQYIDSSIIIEDISENKDLSNSFVNSKNEGYLIIIVDLKLFEYKSIKKWRLNILCMKVNVNITLEFQIKI